MVKLIINIIFELRLRRAIKEANKIKKLTKYRCYVLLVKGRPVVYSKKDLKESIARRHFKKGFTIDQLDKIALYKTQ
ncbi:MAG: hypothetical protein RBR40_08340 [Tenuifilaceae bacterium]|nr:hypothetical protein [Tenuifilaceae bacterium]